MLPADQHAGAVSGGGEITENTKTCGECEYFGDYDKIIAGPWEPDQESGGKYYTSRFLGFDESAGAICGYPRTGTKTRCYDHSRACYLFKERTWARPDSCHNCDRKHGEMSDGSALCSGWPYYMKVGDEPCQNGRAAYGENLKLF